MATIGILIARIEARMALAAGLDVQTIDEPRLLEMLRHKYNTIFDENWWMPYMTLESFALDGVNGLIVGSVENKILRFEDIHSVYYGRDPNPLPLVTLGSNPLLRDRPALAPYTHDPEKMFKVYPVDRDETVQVWYRTRMSDDQWEEGDDNIVVNMDDELLIAGTIYDYLIDDGSNPEAAQKYERLFAKRLDQLQKLQFQAPIDKRSAYMNYPREWSDRG